MQVDLYNGRKTAVVFFVFVTNSHSQHKRSNDPSLSSPAVDHKMKPVNGFLWLGSARTLFCSML